MTRNVISGVSLAATLLTVWVTACAGESKTVENQYLRVSLNRADGTFRVFDKRVGDSYIPGPIATRGLSAISARHTAAGSELRMSLALRALKLKLRLTLRANAPMLVVELSGEASQSMPKGPFVGAFQYPPPLLLDTPDGYLVVPANSEGFRVGVHETNFALPAQKGGPWRKSPPNNLTRSMAWHGACDMKRGFGFMVIHDTPYDVHSQFVACSNRGRKVLAVREVLLSEMGRWGYTRRFVYHFFDRGHYVAMAKAYREWAKGKIVPFRERVKTNPYIDRLVGAAKMNVSTRQPIPALLPAFNRLGFNKILFFVYGGGTWREKAIPACRAIDEAGYLAGQYNLMHYIGVSGERARRMKDTGVKFPDDARVMFNGRLAGGLFARGGNPQSGVLCLSKLKDGLRRSTEVKNEVRGHVHLFYHDGFGTEYPNECYNPAHPHTRRQDAKTRLAIYQYIHSLQGGKMLFATEIGPDWGLPGTDLCYGIMGVGYDLGFGMGTSGNPRLFTPAELRPRFIEFEMSGRRRLPLFSLVYHGVAVSSFTFYTTPSRIPSLWARKDLINMLHAAQPSWVLNGWYAEEFFWLNIDRFIETYNNVCRWAQTVGYDEMTDHALLTPNGDVQRSAFSSGYTITVNLGDKPYKLPDGTELPGSAYLITGKPNPNIAVGKPVRIDPNWKPIDPGFEQVRVGRTSGWVAGKGITFTATESEIAPHSKAFEAYLKRIERMRKIGHDIVLHPEASGHFFGKCEDNFYVRTRDFKVIPGFKYHFEGWLKLSKISDAKARPAFSIEIENEDGTEIARHVWQ